MRLKVELSRRETEVAHLLAWGASKKEVADMLFISTRTVENTARNIYAKVGIQKATELCVWWFCTKHNVPVSLDPLKRTFVAVALLLITPEGTYRKRRFFQSRKTCADNTDCQNDGKTQRRKRL